MVSVSRRVGGQPHEWARRPWRYTRWVFLTLQEQDYVEQWAERMERIQHAQLMAQALIAPERLSDEYRKGLADAASHEGDADMVADARRMIERLERSGAMCDTADAVQRHRATYYGEVS